MKTSPKDFFLHLGVIVTLYISTISLLTLIFQIANIALPDRLETYVYFDPYSTGLRWAIASLFIVFPLYLILSWLLNRDYRFNPAKRELTIRKWLIYITLFGAGIALATDLVTLINYFLGGEITERFVIKVLAVLVVTAGVFGYYLYDIRRAEALPKKTNRLYAGLAVLLVLGSIVGGFMVMGSPFTVRQIRFDERRVSDLQNLQWQLVQYWQQKEVLPASLAGLKDEIAGYVPPVDPETGEAYVYNLKGARQFELCARFNLVSRPTAGNSYARPIGFDLENETWEHAAGLTCFTRTIDPERYPPSPKGPKGPNS
jgi:hypothetical protein